MTQPKPPTAQEIEAARDRHRAAAEDANLGPTARRHHQHAACGYDWALRALGTPTAIHHLGYARAYAEQAAQHAPATTRLTLTLPAAFCRWADENGRTPQHFTGDETADRLRLALQAGTKHQIDASTWTLTIPGHDPVAMQQLTALADEFADHCHPDNHPTSIEVRASIALSNALKNLAERHLAAK
ncbi:hypothetical protein [Kitasatospora cineracea]|uniref:Uncharacterized protein n=1 Tax=Kitasatospora cineracea TaxID=88074 RepID=A0A8G1UJV9_9ACTN|nr:hypothetical protein [Kitasatospora cineracea]ROR42909.1 hypothetical protein EDD39_1043 [Kitasatospora cineracea]